jgi:hypothetical protein
MLIIRLQSLSQVGSFIIGAGGIIIFGLTSWSSSQFPSLTE